MKNHTNGSGSQEVINYPVQFDLKIFMTTPLNHNDNITLLEPVLTNLNIPFSNWRHKISDKGVYISYTVHVTVISQIILNQLYANLKDVQGVKFAL